MGSLPLKDYALRIGPQAHSRMACMATPFVHYFKASMTQSLILLACFPKWIFKDPFLFNFLVKCWTVAVRIISQIFTMLVKDLLEVIVYQSAGWNFWIHLDNTNWFWLAHVAFWVCGNGNLSRWSFHHLLQRRSTYPQSIHLGKAIGFHNPSRSFSLLADFSQNQMQSGYLFQSHHEGTCFRVAGTLHPSPEITKTLNNRESRKVPKESRM